MGTFTDSTVRVCRKSKGCRECDTPIYVGVRYLVYKLGLRNDVHVHIRCALAKADKYPCAALDAERASREAVGL